MIVTSPSKVEMFMEDEEVDASNEDLSERAEGSSEHRASLLHAVCEQKVPNARGQNACRSQKQCGRHP